MPSLQARDSKTSLITIKLQCTLQKRWSHTIILKQRIIYESLKDCLFRHLLRFDPRGVVYIGCAKCLPARNSKVSTTNHFIFPLHSPFFVDRLQGFALPSPCSQPYSPGPTPHLDARVASAPGITWVFLFNGNTAPKFPTPPPTPPPPQLNLTAAYCHIALLTSGSNFGLFIF